MASYVMHIAIAQEYLKNYNEEDKDEFIYGAIYPDLIKPKSVTHFGKDPQKTNLIEFLKYNKINTSYKRGWFLHLITDYLFYNHYLDRYSQEIVYRDYNIINKKIIDKYEVNVLEEIADIILLSEEGTTQILSFELACKIIDEVSKMNLDVVKEDVLKNPNKWNYYKDI